MIHRSELRAVCAEALDLIDRAGIPLSAADRAKITAADFGLSRLRQEGIEILTMYETERAAGKILVLLPHQTEPEHWHPRVGDDPGKEETVRAVWGDLYFYVPDDFDVGRDADPPTEGVEKGFVVEGKEAFYTLRREVDLRPGQQLTFPPMTPHWFQAGPRGAVMFSFSTPVRDGLDGFRDSGVVRETVVGE